MGHSRLRAPLHGRTQHDGHGAQAADEGECYDLLRVDQRAPSAAPAAHPIATFDSPRPAGPAGGSAVAPLHDSDSFGLLGSAEGDTDARVGQHREPSRSPAAYANRAFESPQPAAGGAPGMVLFDNSGFDLLHSASHDAAAEVDQQREPGTSPAAFANRIFESHRWAPPRAPRSRTRRDSGTWVLGSLCRERRVCAVGTCAAHAWFPECNLSAQRAKQVAGRLLLDASISS